MKDIKISKGGIAMKNIIRMGGGRYLVNIPSMYGE